MVRYVKFLLLLILTIACVAIATFLYLIWNASAVTAVMPESRVGYTIEALSVNIMVLQIVLGLVAFVVAVLGFFGYAGIKSAAQDIAEKEAKKVTDKQMALLRTEQERITPGPRESPGSYAPSEVSLEGAQPAGGRE